MVPKISIDTANLEKPIDGHNGIELSNVEGARNHNLSPTTARFDDPSHLAVPGTVGHGLSPSSDGSSTKWEDSTAHDNEKERFEVSDHVRDLIAHDDEATGPFAFTNKQLQALVDPKELEMLRQLGGIKGLEKGLQTDLLAGLSWDETTVPVGVTFAEAQAANEDGSVTKVTPPPVQQISRKPTLGIRRSLTARSTMKAGEGKMTDRTKIYGANVLPVRKTKNIFQLMWIALQDKILIILSIAAVVSLGLGLYETFDGEDTIDPLTGKAAPHLEWVEGVAIIVAIAIVTIVGSANDFQKERQFAKLNKKVSHDALVLCPPLTVVERR